VLERLVFASYALFIGGVFGASGYARLGYGLPRRLVRRCEWLISRGDRVPIPPAWTCVAVWWMTGFAAMLVLFAPATS
jgi:hypothetical protein